MSIKGRPAHLWVLILAGVLTGCETIINVVGADWIPGPVWARAVTIMLITASGFILRWRAQRGMGDGQ